MEIDKASRVSQAAANKKCLAVSDGVTIRICFSIDASIR